MPLRLVNWNVEWATPRAALQRAIPPHMAIATSGLTFQGSRSIDHIALSDDLAAESLCVISNIHGETELTDHFGVVADLSVCNRQ